MIRHAGLRLPPAVLPLMVAVIEAAFRALLVPAIGTAPLEQPGVTAAGVAAISLAAITARTDKENGVTSTVLAKPLPQNHLAMRHHACSQAALDTGDDSVAP